LRVLFVGRDIFRKGLLPTLDALDDLRAHGVQIEATIVCALIAEDYTSKGRSADRAALIDRMMRSPNITHRFSVPNEEVHSLMQSHDVFLFPSVDESLGWVAVEAAMAGMPIIATDIFAIPELVVDGKTGFLIPMRVNEISRWAGLALRGQELDQEFAYSFSTIREHLVRHLTRLAGAPELVRTMGDASKCHIEKLYSVSTARRTLASIYEAAIDC
jgi:glycosyltransferase involved in cell wall biosynthesis